MRRSAASDERIRERYNEAMRFEVIYVVRGKSTLFDAVKDPELRAELASPRWIRSKEGGRTVWRPEDHAALIKVAFLLELKLDMPDVDLVRGEAASAALFDAYWELERIVDSINVDAVLDEADPSLLAGRGTSGSELADLHLASIESGEHRREWALSLGPPQLRVWTLDGDVIGWIREYALDGRTIRGDWDPIRSPRGHGLVARLGSEPVQVVVEGGVSWSAALQVADNRAHVELDNQLTTEMPSSRR